MSSITDEQKSRIISLFEEGKLNSREISEKTGVPFYTVVGMRVHYNRGTYADIPENEEVVEALEATFGLERDLQIALRHNIEQLEKGLQIIDKGKETITEAGRIDILAEDKGGNTVVIELKAGAATSDAIAQVLSYMGTVSSKNRETVRGILVAGDFPHRVVCSAKAVPNLQLKKYKFKFSFEDIK